MFWTRAKPDLMPLQAVEMGKQSGKLGQTSKKAPIRVNVKTSKKKGVIEKLAQAWAAVGKRKNP